jgi:hypothetical protein
MSWRWVSSGDKVVDLDRTFPTQGDAETWLGEFYLDLLDDGVKAVSLYEEDRHVYGPMPLGPRVSPDQR